MESLAPGSYASGSSPMVSVRRSPAVPSMRGGMMSPRHHNHHCKQGVFGQVFWGLFVAVLVFLTALAWNDAILSSIRRGSLGEAGEDLPNDLTGKWVYTVILTIILIIVAWIASRTMNKYF